MENRNYRFQFIVADADHFFAINDAGFLLIWPNSGGPISSSAPQNTYRLPDIEGRAPDLVHVFSGGRGRLYLVNRAGDLYLIRYVDGALAFSGQRIGQGWGECLHIVCDGTGSIYAVMADGALRYYRDLDRAGHWSWDERSSHPIGTEWNRFRFVLSGGQGVLYAIDNDGFMYWFRHEIRDDGMALLGSPSGLSIGSDWHLFTHVFSGKSGEIYCVDVVEQGCLLKRYVDMAQDGTSNGWTAPSEIGLGWQCIPLEGYVWPPSAAPGECLQLRLSAVNQGVPCNIQLMRVIDINQAEHVGTAIEQTLVYQRVDTNAWQEGCCWESIISFEVPLSAPSGLYVFRCELPTGFRYDVPATVLPWLPGRPVARNTAGLLQEEASRGLTGIGRGGTLVRRRREGDFAFVVNLNTWCAYNTWGGCSNYSFPESKVLSLQRPNHHLLVPKQDHPRGNHLYRAELQVHAWLASQPYKVDALTDWDVQCGTFKFSDYSAVILAAHPEYWTGEMIFKLQEYLIGGGHVIYLGGNAMFRPVSPRGGGSSFATDTVQESDAGRWTHSFWQGVDRSLLGIKLGTLDSTTPDRGYRVSLPADADDSRRPYIFLRNPSGGLLARDREIIGNEEGHIPAYGWETEWAEVGDMHVVALAHDPEIPDRISMAYRENVRGGWSFGVGSILFGQSLRTDTRVQQILVNVLNACLTR